MNNFFEEVSGNTHLLISIDIDIDLADQDNHESDSSDVPNFKEQSDNSFQISDISGQLVDEEDFFEEPPKLEF